MEGLQNLLTTGTSMRTISCEEWEKQKVESYNQSRGNLTGYDCPDCLNRGDFLAIQNGEEIYTECRCMEIRRSMSRLQSSGLSGLVERYTLENYTTGGNWQKRIKESALRFLESPKGNWFFVGGQVGAGKTHICTAIVGELMRRGIPAKYMLWRDEAVRLKGMVNEEGEYAKRIGMLKTIPCLYIDDLFKTERGKAPTTADINLAFEILNYRYIQKDLITLISSEKIIDELLEIDEAVGSRIYERTKGYCLQIAKDPGKNMRLSR